MGLRLNGATSGSVELNAPAIAGTTTLELPTDSIKPGLVLVAAQSFTTAATVSINNCFTSVYDDYRVEITYTATNAGNLQFRLRVAGVDNTTAAYGQQYIAANGTSVTGVRDSAQTFGRVTQHPASDATLVTFDMSGPALAQFSKINSRGNYGSAATQWLFAYAGTHAVASPHDGITLYPDAGTITGSLSIYGYRKAL